MAASFFHHSKLVRTIRSHFFLVKIGAGKIGAALIRGIGRGNTLTLAGLADGGGKTGGISPF
jgi:hypothetical protein